MKTHREYWDTRAIFDVFNDLEHGNPKAYHRLMTEPYEPDELVWEAYKGYCQLRGEKAREVSLSLKS